MIDIYDLIQENNRLRAEIEQLTIEITAMKQGYVKLVLEKRELEEQLKEEVAV